MKNILILTIAVMTFSCNLEQQKQAKANAAFELKVEQEINSGIRNDTIFLGYRFGMSEKEFISWTKKLIRDKKLYENENRQVAYKMTLDDNNFLATAEAVFSPEYFEGKLYKLNISVEPTDHTVIALTQIQLVKIFSDKYGFYDHTENSVIDDSKDYIWIDGNRQIEIIKGFSDARIFYTDLTAERSLNQLKEIEQSEELKTTTNDI
ncbi:hypothetical protein [Marinoscillum pacificum]|uniref:hypothetical protein n=1 Tax=Marinoscillum pacificum TaxID=392723 RepID=UPI00215862C9|nr:hypothetical protein [Marinoscillum pacificum]